MPFLGSEPTDDDIDSVYRMVSRDSESVFARPLDRQTPCAASTTRRPCPVTPIHPLDDALLIELNCVMGEGVVTNTRTGPSGPPAGYVKRRVGRETEPQPGLGSVRFGDEPSGGSSTAACVQGYVRRRLGRPGRWFVGNARRVRAARRAAGRNRVDHRLGCWCSWLSHSLPLMGLD